MPYPRLLPILIIRDGGLYKSENFKTWTYVGDTLNATKIFNEKDVDEIVVLSVDSHKSTQPPDYELLTRLAEECFMPIAYGGGITNEDQARRIVDCGVDKVILNSSIRENPELLTKISNVIGSSSTMASIDAICVDGGFFAFDHKSHAPTNRRVEELIAQFEQSGAGEIMFQSVDRDGSRSGPDLELASLVANASKLPTIYAGGVTSLDDATNLWTLGIDAVAAGSWFVFNGPHKAVLITYPKQKSIVRAYQNFLLQIDSRNQIIQ